MNLSSKIFVAGHRGLVGSSLVRKLNELGYTNVLLRTRDDLNLLNQKAVDDFFEKNKPEYVFLAAARVGGIQANSKYQADFLYENLTIQTNVMHAAAMGDVKKLLFLGSSCVYPREAPQPMSEKSLLTGPLEPTNLGYAVAKIAGLKLCEYYSTQYGKSFITVIPANLYGPGDNFNPEQSHVIPGILRKFHEAKVKGLKSVEIWGTGKAIREFLYIDDLTEALLFLMEKYNSPEPINIGGGLELSIGELAKIAKQVVGFTGEINFDTSKPDGMPKKLLDNTQMQNLGWKAQWDFKKGLTQAYQWALEKSLL